MLGRWWVVVVLGVLLGCDAAEPSGKGAPKRQAEAKVAKAEAPAKPTDKGEEAIPITLPETPPRGDGARARGGGAETETVSESFGPGNSLPDCMSNCETRALSDDNRATCRLLCKSHYARADKPDRSGLLDGYIGCFDACEGEAGCRKRCSGEASRGDACVSTCFDGLGRCLAPCEGGSDAGRCTERCETTARNCVGAC
jgi:hypothetical protein